VPEGNAFMDINFKNPSVAGASKVLVIVPDPDTLTKVMLVLALGFPETLVEILSLSTVLPVPAIAPDIVPVTCKFPTIVVLPAEIGAGVFVVFVRKVKAFADVSQP
jgi:hypothetical protein